jgi:hypothetical protein
MMKMDMKSNIKQYFFILIGAIIVGVIVYPRLLQVRVPKEILYPLSILDFTLYFLFASLFFGISSYIEYTYHRIRFNMEFKNEGVWLGNIFNKWSKYYSDSLKAFNLFLVEQIFKKKVPVTLDCFADLVLLLTSKKEFVIENYILIYLFLDIFPRVVVLFFFGYDVLWLHEFRYIYKVGILLLIPLLFNFLLYNLEQYSKLNIEYFLAHYIRSTIAALTYDFTLTEESYREYEIFLSKFTTRYANYEVTMFILEDLMDRQLLTPSKTVYQVKIFEKSDENIANSVEDLGSMYMRYESYWRITRVFKHFRIKYGTYWNIIRFSLYGLLWIMVLLEGLGIVP